MDDLISRQDTVEATRYLQTYKLFESDDMLLVDLADVQTTLMMLQSAQQWIPCSEEEPPFGIEVLITRNGTVKLAERSPFDKKYPWYIHGNHPYSAKTVDAWMPLPEPFEG